MDAQIGENPCERENLLKAWEICESAWQHRDKIMWKVLFTFFYAIIICNSLLFVVEKYNFTDVAVAFPFITYLCTYCFLYVAKAYAARLQATRDSINKIRAKLGDVYVECGVEKTYVAKAKLAKWVAVCMFIVLILVDSVALYVLIKHWAVCYIVLMYEAIGLVTGVVLLFSFLKVPEKDDKKHDGNNAESDKK